MNKDQNLIFEAYTKSVIKENAEYDNDALMVNGDEYIVQAIVSGDDVEITTLFKYDKELDDHNEIDLDSISPQLRQDIEDSVLIDAEEDFGNTDYDVEEPPVFERLEELMNSKPELEGVLKPILDEFEDIITSMIKLDSVDGKIDETDLGEALYRLSNHALNK